MLPERLFRPHEPRAVYPVFADRDNRLATAAELARRVREWQAARSIDREIEVLDIAELLLSSVDPTPPATTETETD